MSFRNLEVHLERLIALGLSIATLMVVPAFLAAPRPADACSLMCYGINESLQEPVITLVSGDEEAALPVFAETGTLQVESNGTPFAIQLGDDWISLTAEVE